MTLSNSPDVKKRIVYFISLRGPSLPVHIAKEIQTTILFTSVFLSELVSDKEIKISYLRVGSSPVYYLQGQEPQLEKFSEYLPGKEKEAFSLLKEKKFLKDKEQEPAIRVALREIKDFAIPFQKNNEIYWRYYLISESEFQEEIKEKKETSKKIVIPEKEDNKIKEQNTNIREQEKKQEKKELDIFDKSEKEIKKEEKKISKKVKLSQSPSEKSEKKPVKKKTTKKDENFFDKVKEFLSKDSFEISNIENFSRTELIIKIKNPDREELIVAYNKKRIDEEDIIKASKKAFQLNLPFKVLSFGETPKKIKDLIDALKNLSGIEKIE